jgi:hypothetical protein
MLVDCDRCTARGPACTDCVVTVLLGAPPAAAGGGAQLDGAERAALAVLAGSGLVPPLRLLSAQDYPGPGSDDVGHARPDRIAARSVNRPSPSPGRRPPRRAAG